ncbi:hypothetical protein BGZ98_009173 [Dissophora globulifera]|nr:hypothetical protein BGZ98_009173 [Dissophora globulifera]
MHQFQSFAPPQPPTVAEYAFPAVLQFLQSEWRRFERDRNEWDIEKAEMKARIAFLEGEKRGVDNAKVDLMKRVKMLEYALRQERSKYLEGKDTNAVSAPSQAGVTPLNANHKAQHRISTYSNPSQNMSQVSPTSATPGLDPTGRAKSREFLRICLQEISYLTASVPQSIAMAMPPAPTRLVRNESDRRAAAAAVGARNRKSDIFPSNQPPVVPPPLNRANSVPTTSFQSITSAKPKAHNSHVDPSVVGVAGGVMMDKTEDATLQQFADAPQHALAPTKPRSISVDEAATTKSGQKPTPHSGLSGTKANTANIDKDKSSSEDEDQLDTDEDPITVVHAPISAEHWQARLQKAGQQLSKPPKVKKGHAKGDIKGDDDVQLSKDAQDRLNKMVEDWDKSKQDGSGHKSTRKKKLEDSWVFDELENLSISENEVAEKTKGVDSQPDEPARWRPKVTLRRHMDTVRSIAFHPENKSLLSGSEDGTMKYWNLESALRDTKRPMNGEIDPVHTYRGHTKAITAVAISGDQNRCFSSSMDSTIRSYKLAPMSKETYSRFDPTLAASTFVGHTDAVWDIRLFPLSISSSQLLGSISADGTLKIWDTESKGSLLKSSWGYRGLGGDVSVDLTTAAYIPTPTGMDFCPTDLKKMVVSYSNSVIKLFDIETGKEILKFKSNESYDGTSATQINKVICHPTLPLAVSAHEDRYIRFFDLNSGACSFSMLSHLDAVSSLDIDAAGLVLCSGGHDSSVRLWDIASPTRSCLQEFTGHRRKGDEGVCAVKYHPSRPELLATGGADSIIKVYTRS